MQIRRDNEKFRHTPNSLKKLKYNDPLKYWKLLDKNNASLAEVKEAKIGQLKIKCNEAIQSGFTSTVTNSNGVAYEFGFSTSHDQLNFNSRLNKINLWKNQLSDGTITQSEYDAKFPIEWKTENLGVVNLTEIEFIQVTDDGESHLLNQQNKYWNLENQVINATTKDDVIAIKW